MRLLRSFKQNQKSSVIIGRLFFHRPRENESMSQFQDAINFRHACKVFDNEKNISPENFQKILNFGRLSPSSFGMEPWRFKVINTTEAREKLRVACWNQPQITDSSHVVVICAITTDVEPGSDYVGQLFKRRNLPEEATQVYLEKYATHHAKEIAPRMNTYAWSSKQCYLALANMMTGAASLEIDSCPIEGFEKDAVEKVLNIDTDNEEVAVIVTFGYRAGEQTSRLRLELDELLRYI